MKNWLSGAFYFQILGCNLSGLLKDVVLDVRQTMLFLQNSAQPHFLCDYGDIQTIPEDGQVEVIQ